MIEKGSLFVCATPIGNLRDVTLRVLDTLKQVDFIAAEDTRHSRKLLNYYNIKTPLLSYHQHNEKKRAAEIIARIKKGENCALISDAGMPGISDPGQILINECRQAGIEIDVLPGPNAALTALVLSGMPADSFLFLGFLPGAKGKRQELLEKISTVSATIILYEAPHKLVRTLQDVLEVIGDRQAAVLRELTKVNQTVYKAPVSELLEKFQAFPPKGECCLLLAPYEEEIEPGKPSDWLAEIGKLESEGITCKEAMKTVALKFGVSKREIYKAYINEKKR
ncbi:MAG: 16S rRNA (cytidine(1402)-2'-O)-methyltransferase [Desulfitobacteriia bacterium]|jgi:16S rRNA (cytidine1402-2'-O)-methyltransferase